MSRCFAISTGGGWKGSLSLSGVGRPRRDRGRVRARRGRIGARSGRPDRCCRSAAPRRASARSHSAPRPPRSRRAVRARQGPPRSDRRATSACGRAGGRSSPLFRRAADGRKGGCGGGGRRWKTTRSRRVGGFERSRRRADGASFCADRGDVGYDRAFAALATAPSSR